MCYVLFWLLDYWIYVSVIVVNANTNPFFSTQTHKHNITKIHSTSLPPKHNGCNKESSQPSQNVQCSWMGFQNKMCTKGLCGSKYDAILWNLSGIQMGICFRKFIPILFNVFGWNIGIQNYFILLDVDILVNNYS